MLKYLEKEKPELGFILRWPAEQDTAPTILRGINLIGQSQKNAF